MKLFFLKLKSSAALEAQLNRKIGLRLKRRQEELPGYRERLDFTIRTRLSTMKLIDHLRFKVYHRQFEGTATILVPTTVRAARMIAKSFFTVTRYRKIWN